MTIFDNTSTSNGHSLGSAVVVNDIAMDPIGSKRIVTAATLT